MKTIKYRKSRNPENVEIVRAEIGLRWAMFSFSGELLRVGEGRSCEPTADELTQMIADAPAAIDAIVATEKPVVPACQSNPLYRRHNAPYNMYADSRRTGFDLGREMDREDSPW